MYGVRHLSFVRRANKSSFIALSRFGTRATSVSAGCYNSSPLGTLIRFYSELSEPAAHSNPNQSPPPPPQNYDFIIAGGGLVGSMLAVALARTKRLEDKSILVLETSNRIFKSEPPNENDKTAKVTDFSNRVFAISPGSKAVLQKFGIWDHVWRCQEVKSLQVWDGLSNASIDFENPDLRTPVSYIVENPVLNYAVSKALEGSGGNVQIEYGSFVNSCTIPTATEPYTNLAKVVLKDGRTFTTDLLIGADGYGSRVRSAINSNYVSFNYDRTAIVATLKLTEETENNIAWQRFLTTGTIALLPLSPSYSSLVWCTTPKQADELMNLSQESFVDALNTSLWQTYDRSILVQQSCDLLSSVNMPVKGPKMLPPSISEIVDGSRATFKLGFGHSSYYVNRRSVLIGDAAHRVHPMAGQGLNLGIGDISCLQRIIDKSVGLGCDFGQFSVLREYETERQRHNLTIQGGIEFLHRLYSFDLAPIVALRTLGLSFVNSSDMLKVLACPSSQSGPHLRNCRRDEFLRRSMDLKRTIEKYLFLQ